MALLPLTAMLAVHLPQATRLRLSSPNLAELFRIRWYASLTMSSKSLVKQYTSFFFALNELHPEILDTFAENRVHKMAYALAAMSFVNFFEHEQDLADGSASALMSCTLNPDDTYIEVRGGVLAWSIQVEAAHRLDAGTHSALCNYFETCYMRAAQGSLTSVRYVDSERFEVYSDHEMLVEDFV